MAEAGPGGGDHPAAFKTDANGPILPDIAEPGHPACRTTARRTEARFHAGPLPPPAMLREYDEEHPGAAAWILAQAEKAAEHDRMLQLLAVKAGARDALLYRLLPFSTVITLILASVLIAIFASTWLGGVTFAASLGAVMLDYLRRHSRP